MTSTNLNVLYEDNHLLVVEKGVNILSQKDITGDIDMTEIVSNYLKTKYNKPGNVYVGLIHRLDRRVGGVMIIAKTSKAAKRLSEDIRNHKFTKTYLGYVEGRIVNDGSINVKIEKDEKTKMAIITNKGQDSKLNYQVINYHQNSTYVLIDLVTGRYNQIRASFAHIGHPIINDYKYNNNIALNKNDIGLYCYRLGINHPITKEYMEFTNFPSEEIWDECKLKRQI
jgi:23S rRNA pseudouridine1911/1915/1917 synthase